MGGCKLIGSVACILVMLQISSANPFLQQKIPFVSQYPGCPNYKVGQRHPTQSVTLDEKLTFIVRPNRPTLVMDVDVSQDQLYQAVVHGAMITLKKCRRDHTQCETMKEESSKSSDLLNVHSWNYINVTLEGSQITIDVNLKESIMGNLMSVQWDEENQHSNVKVSLHQAGIEGYSLDATVLCNRTYTPEVEEMPMEQVPDMPEPFPTCPTYQVKEGEPLEHLKLDERLTLAVLSSEPSLQLKVSFGEELYQAKIMGSMTVLEKCLKNATHCETVEEGGAKDTDTLTANQWNYVTISKDDDKVTVSVNQRLNVMRQPMVVSPNTNQATVTVIASGGISASHDSPDNNNHTILVKINCTDTQGPVTSAPTQSPDTISTITTTIDSHHADASHGENTTEAPGTRESTYGEAWRIMAILMTVLAIILAIVLTWHCVSRRCKSQDIQQWKEMQQSQAEEGEGAAK